MEGFATLQFYSNILVTIVCFQPIKICHVINVDCCVDVRHWYCICSHRRTRPALTSYFRQWRMTWHVYWGSQTDESDDTNSAPDRENVYHLNRWRISIELSCNFEVRYVTWLLIFGLHAWLTRCRPVTPDHQQVGPKKPTVLLFFS